MNKLRHCRICGKKGIRFASDGCKYCGSDYVTNTQWQLAKQKGLTKGKVIKKAVKKDTFKYVKKVSCNAVKISLL